jgi:hypothetical protein
MLGNRCAKKASQDKERQQYYHTRIEENKKKKNMNMVRYQLSYLFLDYINFLVYQDEW